MVTEAAATLVGGGMQPAWNCLTVICRSLKRKHDRVKNLDENWRKLEIAEKDLKSLMADVKAKITINPGKQPNNQCKNWLDAEKKNIEKVCQLKSRYENANRFLCGLWSLFSLSKLSKEMETLMSEITLLVDKIKPGENVLIEKDEPFVDQFPKKIDMLPSLIQNVEKLLNLLRERNVKKIGIYGTEGIGKTTIMKNLNNAASSADLFHIIIFVTVEVPNPGKIREKIVERLKLNLPGNTSEGGVSHIISEALKEKKYLLLLDKVRSNIDLDELGIHESHEHGKVVVATRHRVICDEIGVQEYIPVERMSNDDALVLFQQIVGDVAKHAHLKQLAKLIAEECGGLPLVIKIVATTLKNERDELIWQQTLERLRSSTEPYLENLDDVRSAFELSIDKLKDHMKKCLLYAAMFPGDHEIYDDHMMECWRAEEFIPVVQQSKTNQIFRKGREEGRATLKHLTNACFLERCRRGKYVKMPSLFRRWALRIENDHARGCLSLASADEEMGDATEVWRDPKRISLIDSNLSALPERPECRRMTSLFLQGNQGLQHIPLQFFDCMGKLKLLDLFNTGIRSLPTSISMLINLRALYLNGCQWLGELPTEVTSLENLEILDTRSSGIHSLPPEVGNMAGLRCLKISFTNLVSNHSQVGAQQLQAIPSGVFARLSSLEELIITVDFRDQSWNTVVDTIAKEVATLKVLNTLYFYFPRVECFAEFIRTSISWNNTQRGNISFRSFRILVGSHGTHRQHEIDVSGWRGERHLKFFAGSGDNANEIEQVLRQACTFELIGHQTINDLTNFSIDSMEGLEFCVIQECNQMKSIIDCSQLGAVAALPQLNELHLINLKELISVWGGPIRPESLPRLTTLTIYGCSKLTEILTAGLARHLPLLQHLRVESCSRTAAVIKEVEITDDLGILPKLESLELVNLPQLASICDQEDSLEWHSLKKIVINGCTSLKNLSLRNGNAKQLKSIECSRGWWDALKREQAEVIRHLEPVISFQFTT